MDQQTLTLHIWQLIDLTLRVAALIVAIDLFRQVWFTSSLFVGLRDHLETEASISGPFGWWWRTLLVCPYCLTYWISLVGVVVLWVIPEHTFLYRLPKLALLGLCAAHLVNRLTSDPRQPPATQTPEREPEQPDTGAIAGEPPKALSELELLRVFIYPDSKYSPGTDESRAAMTKQIVHAGSISSSCSRVRFPDDREILAASTVAAPVMVEFGFDTAVQLETARRDLHRAGFEFQLRRD